MVAMGPKTHRGMDSAVAYCSIEARGAGRGMSTRLRAKATTPGYHSTPDRNRNRRQPLSDRYGRAWNVRWLGSRSEGHDAVHPRSPSETGSRSGFRNGPHHHCQKEERVVGSVTFAVSHRLLPLLETRTTASAPTGLRPSRRKYATSLGASATFPSAVAIGGKRQTTR